MLLILDVGFNSHCLGLLRTCDSLDHKPAGKCARQCKGHDLENDLKHDLKLYFSLVKQFHQSFLVHSFCNCKSNVFHLFNFTKATEKRTT